VLHLRPGEAALAAVDRSDDVLVCPRRWEREPHV